MEEDKKELRELAGKMQTFANHCQVELVNNGIPEGMFIPAMAMAYAFIEISNEFRGVTEIQSKFERAEFFGMVDGFRRSSRAGAKVTLKRKD